MAVLVRLLRPIVSKSPFLSSVYRKLRDIRSLRREPQLTPLGFRLGGSKAMEEGSFEPIETRLVSRLLEKADAVVNIGANIGYYCCMALQQGKQVVAFEPMPVNQHHLMRNVLANGWEDRFEDFPMALSDQSGLIEIYGAGTGASLVKGWAGQENSMIVPVSTLDKVLGDRFAATRVLAIVDVEGAEYRLLQGATEQLASPTPPVWFVEISGVDHQPQGSAMNPNYYKTFELFAQHGYAAITADEHPRIVELAEVRTIQDTANSAGITHNFIFVASSRTSEILDLLDG